MSDDLLLAGGPLRAQSWTLGRWGKGFVSEGDVLYTWNTSDGVEGVPVHGARFDLVDAVEGPGTALEHVQRSPLQRPYRTPIIIAPDGFFAVQTSSLLYELEGDGRDEDSDWLELHALRFVREAGLRWVRDMDRWIRRHGR